MAETCHEIKDTNGDDGSSHYDIGTLAARCGTAREEGYKDTHTFIHTGAYSITGGLCFCMPVIPSDLFPRMNGTSGPC